MSSPEIAVIVPVFNGAKYLPACVESIAAQRFADFVCVLVDDGSTDKTPALCDDIAAGDGRFVVVHKRNGGAAAARLTGVQTARAYHPRWFAFCDADDLLHPDFLGEMHRAATESGMPIACCRRVLFTDDAVPAPGPLTAKSTLYSAPDHLDALLHNHDMDFGLWNKLYTADLPLEELLDNNVLYNEDLMANWRIFLLAKGCVYLPYAGYRYRQHAASMSHALPPQSLDDQRAVALHIRESVPAQWPALQQSADAFYYEKLVYLTSMILRREDTAPYRVQYGEMLIAISSGLKDRRLGRNPRLPLVMRLSAVATVRFPKLWRRLCQKYLKDRQ